MRLLWLSPRNSSAAQPTTSSNAPSSSAQSPAFGLRLRIGVFFALAAFVAIAIRAGYLARDNQFGQFVLVDIHAFYITGKIFHDGLIDKAYELPFMQQAQQAFAGSTSFMPWTYPPPFNLVVALLATMPFVVAYVVFVSSTLAAYLAVLYKLRPGTFPLAISLGFTSSIVMIICGQNGFLTAAIIGLFCLFYLKASLWAGAILGLMVIKPHLAVGLGLWLLFRKEFTLLFAAAAMALVLCVLATLVMEPSVWIAFLNATVEAGGYLRDGEYPLYRMTSAYAGLRSAGAPGQLAFGAHLAIAAIAIGVIFLAARNETDTSTSLGIAILCTFFISPYVYDYDLPILGVAFTLMWPTLSRSAGNLTLSGILALSWMAGGCAVLSIALFLWLDNENMTPIALGWIIMGSLAALTLRIIYPRGLASLKMRPA